ncbi:MAG: porin [Neisseriaceae bacterium]|nr:porin [Neisseriaceae bacterium]
MKKTLIALALVSLPVAAMADVTLYGQLKGGVDFKKSKATVAGEKLSDGTTTNVGDYGSRIGFKGFEDLGNGLKAIWQVEQSVSLAGDSGKGWSNRETFVGLEGGFGKIRVGNLDNFAKSDMETTDEWEYSDNSPALGLAIFNQNNNRYGQSIRYDSPEFAGFYGSLQYTNSDDRNGENFGTNMGSEEASVYGVGLGYNYGPYFAKYAFTLDKTGYNEKNGKRKDAQIHRVEGGYDANNLLVAVGYEYGKGVNSYAATLIDSVGDKEASEIAAEYLPQVKSHQVAVTGAYTMGNLTPKMTYAHGFKEKKATDGDKIADSKYDQVIIGADYALSKRTTALVSAGWLRYGKGDNKIEQTAGSVGLRHKF